MITQKDKKILKELDRNSRQSITQIGKKTNIGKETTNYTIKRLEKEGIITGYFSLINYFKLGFNIFKILARYSNAGEKEEQKIIQWVKKNPEIVWAGKVQGKWDIVITIRERKLEKIYNLLNEFNTKFSKNIQEQQLLISHQLEWLNEKYLYDGEKENFTITMKQKDEKIKIDDKDRKLIELIELNARIPTVEIATKLKLTAEATAKRIKNLIKNKLIAGFKLRLNTEALNKQYNHIFISLKDFSKINEIVSYYKNSKNCIFIMMHYGAYDLHIETITESQKEFREIITELREKFGNIISDYQSVSILEEYKLA